MKCRATVVVAFNVIVDATEAEAKRSASPDSLTEIKDIIADEVVKRYDGQFITTRCVAVQYEPNYESFRPGDDTYLNDNIGRLFYYGEIVE